MAKSTVAKTETTAPVRENPFEKFERNGAKGVLPLILGLATVGGLSKSMPEKDYPDFIARKLNPAPAKACECEDKDNCDCESAGTISGGFVDIGLLKFVDIEFNSSSAGGLTFVAKATGSVAEKIGENGEVEKKADTADQWKLDIVKKDCCPFRFTAVLSLNGIERFAIDGRGGAGNYVDGTDEEVAAYTALGKKVVLAALVDGAGEGELNCLGVPNCIKINLDGTTYALSANVAGDYYGGQFDLKVCVDGDDKAIVWLSAVIGEVNRRVKVDFE